MATADKPHLIGCDGPYSFDVAEEGSHRLPCIYVPRLDGVIETARDKNRAAIMRQVVHFCL